MAVEERTRIILRPTPVDDSGFTVKANEDGSFTVRGNKVVRWVRQTNFKNAEAIGYLADRLAQLGVEKELFKKAQLQVVKFALVAGITKLYLIGSQQSRQAPSN